MKKNTYACCSCVFDKIEFTEEYSKGIEAHKRGKEDQGLWQGYGQNYE